MQTPAPITTSQQAMRLTLAASLLVLAQTATAADDISITPGQRQITASKPGIITLRFELENRSGQAQQLTESLKLPKGWDLVTNTAPFLLASGAREVRLIHVVAPRGTAAGSYEIGYQVTSQNNGGLISAQTVTVQMAAQAGVKLAAIAPPSSLLGGENFTVDFVLENTGNQAITYQLNGRDEENYITAIEPKTLNLSAGNSGNIRIKGKIPREITQSSSYRVTLEARGGGKLAEESVNIPLIARTPKGLGKYQKLPGKLTTRYTQQQRKNADGSSSDEYQAQVEYHAHGAIDQAGQHNVEVRLRNGKNNTTNDANNNQQAEYQFNYENGELTVKTGDHNFSGSHLSGNALSGVGVEAVYAPKNEQKRQPLEVRTFSGKSRPGDTTKKKVTGAAVRYQWAEFETGASVIQHETTATTTDPAKKDTVTSVNAAWHGENIGIRTEAAADKDGKAWSIDANGQWRELGVNASYLQADTVFDGSNTDTKQAFANARYQIDDKTSAEIGVRQTRNNLKHDLSKEIRRDKEQTARISHRFGEEQQIEVSLGHRQRTEQDLRPSPTTDHSITATTLEYQQHFETFHVRAELTRGKRKDRIKTSSKGHKQGLTISWKPTRTLSTNAFYNISNDLDSAGKTLSGGINGTYQLNSKTAFSGYVQRNKNTGEKTHAESFEARLTHDMKHYGTLGINARRTNSQANDGKTSRDNIVQLEYSLPLDVPIRKRNNIGSVRGKVRYALDQQPASEVVVQMGGQYAVTDQQGEFIYSDVLAKDYKLQVDASRPNTQGYMLSNEGDEASISVQASQTITPVLELHPASRLSGKLQLYEIDTVASVFEPSNTNSLRPGNGLGRVLIELRPVGNIGKRIVHKRTTLHDGSFSFVGIPPGQWQLVIVDSEKIPTNYRLEQTQFAIDLSSGGTQELLVRALPIAQSIKKIGPTGGFNVAG
ncbi:porin family protein [Candidatus Thiothrix anitrata]|uniref:Alpha-galactosidase NEW3 domain-containing protein n=1 Tax=Candidatus Thiothrix anitrata TaxID=2823902 RepID=A0ABX7X166_9GAMM|nr:cadherin repeat domain-containing protein [Candidatus Thiothrix anitrata]QTR49007.1 hypothetical protein J8380_12065 [Candidatus Thiothrix anitrata]